MASTEGSFDDGVSKEKEYSRVLFGSGQAQALQYAFFAQRAATKVRLFVVDLLAGTEYICLTSLTRAKCGTRSTLFWKVGNISGSTELFAL